MGRGEGQRSTQEDRSQMRAEQTTNAMTNGRTQADITEKMIKNGTLKEEGGREDNYSE